MGTEYVLLYLPMLVVAYETVWVVRGVDLAGQPPCRGNMCQSGPPQVQQQDINKHFMLYSETYVDREGILSCTDYSSYREITFDWLIHLFLVDMFLLHVVYHKL